MENDPGDRSRFYGVPDARGNNVLKTIQFEQAGDATVRRDRLGRSRAEVLENAADFGIWPLSDLLHFDKAPGRATLRKPMGTPQYFWPARYREMRVAVAVVTLRRSEQIRKLGL